MLTQDDLRIFRKPFRVNEHEFLNGRVYITELAISTRIEMVDPSWAFTEPSITYRDSAVIAEATMTIKGVSRGGVGMEKINSANEAEKSAATDVLKRCARLFGIGRYLLDTPGWVKDHKALEKWLKTLNDDGESDNSEQPEPDAPAQPEQRITAANSPFAKRKDPQLDEHFAPSDFASDGTTDSEPTTTVEVRNTKNGKPFLIVAGISIFKQGVLGELFGGEALAACGMKAGETGKYTLPAPVVVSSREGKGGYRDFVSIRLADAADMNFAA
jgi:hypothetical protein